MPSAPLAWFVLFNKYITAFIKCVPVYVLLLGFYLALNMSSNKDGEKAVLSAPVNIQAPSMCVGFWYFMLGPSVAKLDLVVETVHKNKDLSLLYAVKSIPYK